VIGDHPVVGEGLRAPRSDRGPRLDRPGAARCRSAEPGRMREPAAASWKSRTGRRTDAHLLPSAQPHPADDGRGGTTLWPGPSVTLGTSSQSHGETAAPPRKHTSPAGRPKLVLPARLDDEERSGSRVARYRIARLSTLRPRSPGMRSSTLARTARCSGEGVERPSARADRPSGRLTERAYGRPVGCVHSCPATGRRSSVYGCVAGCTASSLRSACRRSARCRSRARAGSFQPGSSVVILSSR
jgi:hypothetical protein